MSFPHHDHDHDHPPLDPPYLKEVGDGVFAYIQPDGSWMINNTGFITSARGVTVVDTCGTEFRTKAFIEAARQITTAPLRTLINTHHHGDHTYGNHYLPEATIIAHEKARDEVIATGLGLKAIFPTANFGEIVVTPPFVLFEERLTVYADNLKLEIFHVGPAHTTNDIVIWIPERKVLFTGDVVFKDCTPFVLQGAIESYFPALDKLRALGAETIVPGHGPICGAEAFDEMEEYLKFVQATARKGFEAGLTPLELARQTDLGKFKDLTDSERIVGNLHRAYSELRGETLGTSLPLPQIIMESAQFAGHPLRCYA